MKQVALDDVPEGTWVYDSAGLAIGAVCTFIVCNGNSPDIKKRGILTGKYTDRFRYRMSGLYRKYRDQGVFVRDKQEGVTV